MSLLDDINDQIDKTIRSSMTVTKKQESSTSVPDPTDLGFSEGKMIAATYLYTDMLNSSGLAAIENKESAAQVFRAFLNVSTKIIRSNSGHIRSFDGDRVMGIFAGPNRADRAVQAALQIKWSVSNLVTPTIQENFPQLKDLGWELKQVSGIASGETLLARAGFRGNNDMISIGTAPNLAAKLSDIRNPGEHNSHSTLIGVGTFKLLSDKWKISNGKFMWQGPYTLEMAGNDYQYHRSNYSASIS